MQRKLIQNLQWPTIGLIIFVLVLIPKMHVYAHLALQVSKGRASAN